MPMTPWRSATVSHENPEAVWSKPSRLGPMRQRKSMAWGLVGTVDCCHEREPQTLLIHWPLRTARICRRMKELTMDVLVERCAGLDVHRDSVLATVRVRSTK